MGRQQGLNGFVMHDRLAMSGEWAYLNWAHGCTRFVHDVCRRIVDEHLRVVVREAQRLGRNCRLPNP